MKIPITQSKEWNIFQKSLHETTFFEQKENYQFLAILKHTPVGNYLYLPYGPVAKDPKSFRSSLKALEKLARLQKSIFIRIEPQVPEYLKLLPKNTIKSKDLNPKNTWILDLTLDKATLITNFSQGTRTRYNTYQKKGLTVESTRKPSEIHHLVTLQNKLYQRKHLNTFSESYLRSELEQPFATLYLAKYHRPESFPKDEPMPKEGQVLAASLFFDHKGTRYYMQSAADAEYKKLPSTVALLTEAIFDAKAQGFKHFDFWGIAPEDATPSHPWFGFTKFKKSFGGEEVKYAGTYDIVLRPFRYKLYQSTRCFGRVFHR